MIRFIIYFVNSKQAWQEKIMNNEVNFDEKFKELGEYYDIESPLEVKNFLKENRGIFVLLDEVKPYLNESFSSEKYCLEMVYDPECEELTHLVLRIYVSSERFHNGVHEDIENIRFKLRPLRRKHKVLSEFAVRAGVLNV